MKHRFFLLVARAALATITLMPIILTGQQSPRQLFERGRILEEANQDLMQAIRLYGQVAELAKGDRALAAQALLRMAECHQTLGDDKKAREIYNRVVMDYPDQQETKAAAMARLKEASAPAPIARQVWDRSGWDQVSVDGRFIPYPDWSAHGMGIHDLVTGTNRPLATGEVGETIVISPDNSQLVYQYFVGKSGANYVLRLLNLREANPKPRDLMRTDPPRYIEPKGWTPDGKHVLVTQQIEGGIWQIAMISVAEGTTRVLKSLKWLGPDARISPDGRYVAYTAPVDGSVDGQNDIFLLATDASSHTVIVEHLANDYGMVWSSDGSKLLFLSARTGAPSLWAVPVKGGKASGPSELVKSNFDSSLLGMGRNGVLYYLTGTGGNNIYRAELSSEGKVSRAPVIATDGFVNANIGGGISPNGKMIAYYSYRPQPTLIVKSFQTGEERAVPTPKGVRTTYYRGPLWFSDGRSVLVEAQENERPGAIYYRLDVTTGRAEEILRGVSGGLFTPSPVGEVLYHRRQPFTLMRHDLGSGLSTEIIAGRTLTQFSVSPDGNHIAYMEQYDGMKHYSIVSSNGGEPREIYRLKMSEAGGPDRFNALEWTPDQKYLLFVVEEGENSPTHDYRNTIWRVPAAGGEAEQIGVTMPGKIKSPLVHPDGKTLFFTAADTGGEVWALENFLTTSR